MSTELAKRGAPLSTLGEPDAPIDVHRIRHALDCFRQTNVELRYEPFRDYDHRGRMTGFVDSPEMTVDLTYRVRRHPDSDAIARAPLVLAQRLLDEVERLQTLLDARDSDGR